MDKDDIHEEKEAKTPSPPNEQIELEKSESVDTIHNDEALKVLARHKGSETWTEEEEKKLLRKIDWKLVPILMITYGLQYYDKSMLSQAALFGLRTELDLTVGIRYSFCAAIFYLGFICGAYPASMMAQRWPIERVATGIVAVWGITLMCTAAVNSWQGIYAQRFFLGFLEAGVSPMFMLVVGGWYKKTEQGLRMGAWYCTTGYVGIFSPLINYGIGQANGALSPWRYMYLFAGALTFLWSIAIYFFLPPDPIRARGFSERERYIAVARMRTNNSGVRNTHFKREQVFEALIDPRFWLAFSTSFLIMIANGPYSSFVPIIIDGFGFSALNSLLLQIPAGFVTGTVEILASLAAIKTKNMRCWIVVVCQLLQLMAALLEWLLPRSAKGGLLFGVYFSASFGGSYAVLMTLMIANTAGYTKRTVASSGIFIGYCLGNFVGPLLFKAKDAPAYAPGFRAVVATTVAGTACVILYRYVCVWENKKRDKAGTLEAFEHAFEDDLTDVKNPQFRYSL